MRTLVTTALLLGAILGAASPALANQAIELDSTATTFTDACLLSAGTSGIVASYTDLANVNFGRTPAFTATSGSGPSNGCGGTHTPDGGCFLTPTSTVATTSFVSVAGNGNSVGYTASTSNLPTQSALCGPHSPADCKGTSSETSNHYQCIGVYMPGGTVQCVGVYDEYYESDGTVYQWSCTGV